MHLPREPHMEAAYQIFRYLKSKPCKRLLFSQHDYLKIKAYTNADWAGYIMDRWSILGYCTFVERNLVAWHSKKKLVVVRSSAEAEFRAMTHGVCELLWLKILWKELGFDSKDLMKLYCVKLQLILLIIQSIMIEQSMLKLTDTLLKKNSEHV
jgi:hypothetical protein